MIYVCCPPRIATGGVELLQQLVYELNKKYANVAQILYIDNAPEEGNPVCTQYEKYNNPFLVNSYGEANSVYILPEIWVVLAETFFKDHNVVIWWESVDNYFLHTPKERWYSFADNTLHMTQSKYAKDFLENKVGISNDKIIETSDYIDDIILNKKVDFTADFREPNVLYNPVKGFEFTSKLIQASPEINWIPIEKMSFQEVADLMSKSRVYIDFGNHPGKDRIPREAAICGCCVVTGKNGSAAFYEDVPIMDKYKFERADENIMEICECIKSLIEGYNQE